MKFKNNFIDIFHAFIVTSLSLMGLFIFRNSTLFSYYWMNLFYKIFSANVVLVANGVIPFSVASLIVLFFAGIYVFNRESLSAELSTKPIVILLLIVILIGTLPFSLYPPIEHLINETLYIQTSLHYTTAFLVSGGILTILFISKFTSIHDKDHEDLLDRGISRDGVKNYHFQSYIMVTTICLLAFGVSSLILTLSLIIGGPITILMSNPLVPIFIIIFTASMLLSAIYILVKKSLE